MQDQVADFSIIQSGVATVTLAFLSAFSRPLVNWFIRRADRDWREVSLEWVESVDANIADGFRGIEREPVTMATDQKHLSSCVAASVLGGLSAGVANGTIFAGFIIALSFILLVLAETDRAIQILPDELTALLGCLGLVRAAVGGPATMVEASMGIVAGLIVLSALRAGFAFLKGREGLGLGDVKLFAAAGAWVGVLSMPWLVFIAAGLGLSAGLMTARKNGVAFGPYICAALLIILVVG